MSLRQRDAGLKPANRLHAQAGRAIVKNYIGPLADGHINVVIFRKVLQPQMEVRGKHSNDRVIRAVQGQLPADYVRCPAEFALPQARTNQSDGRSADAIFVRSEEAAGCRSNAQRRKEIGGYHFATDMFRFANACEIEIVLAKRRHRSERLVLPLPVEEIGI